MGKTNGLSLCKRFMSLVAGVMLMFSSLPGLAEDNEVEITSDKSATDLVKDNQTNDSKYEVNGDIVRVHQDSEVGNNQARERSMLNTIEEFKKFRKSVLEEKGWEKEIQKYPGSAEEKLKFTNAIILSMSLNSCSNIMKDLEKSDEFVDGNYSFIFENYDQPSGLFYFLFLQTLKKPNLKLSDFIYDGGDKLIFESISDPVEKCANAKQKKSIRTEAQNAREAIMMAYDASNEGNDLQLLIYISRASMNAYTYMTNYNSSDAIVQECVLDIDAIGTNAYNHICDLTAERQKGY